MTEFGFVGLSGVLINMGFLYLLTKYMGLYYIIASIVAIEISIFSNFFLNDCWTFKLMDEVDPYTQNRLQGFFSFQCVSIVGLIITLGILYILTDSLGTYYLVSKLIGIAVVFFRNYLINRRFTWKPEEIKASETVKSTESVVTDRNHAQRNS